MVDLDIEHGTSSPAAASSAAPALNISPHESADLIGSTAGIVGAAIRNGRYTPSNGESLADVAHEILAEALLTANEKASTYDPSRPIVPWILSIAQMKLLSRFRDDKRRPTQSLDALLEAAGEDAFGALHDDAAEAHADARRDVEHMMQTLRPDDALLLRRRYLDDMDVEEIAAEMSLSTDAVEKRLSRARIAARAAGR